MNKQTDIAKADKQSSPKQIASTSSKQNRELLITPENNIVDVFEFEPVGFMSNGRW